VIAAYGLAGADLALFTAGTLLVLLYLGLRLGGRDPLAGNPSPPGRARPGEAFAALVAGAMTEAEIGGATAVVLAATGASTAVALAAAFLWLRKAGAAGPPARGAATGLLCFAASFPVMALVLLGWQAVLTALGGTVEEQPILTSLRSDLTAFFLVAVIGAPLSEEIFFRGLVQGALRRRFGFPLAAVASAAIWAAVHRHLPTVPAHLLLGLALSLTYEKTGTLWGPLAFHAAFNGWQFAQVAAGGR
jgi:membrane protease YdiL (CAAX protease family)